jgi:hypothetical protein
MRSMKSWRSAWRSLTRAIQCPECGKIQDPRGKCKDRKCGADIKGLQSPLARLRFHDLRHQAITELSEGQASDETIMSIVDRFLRKELAAWAKRFPDEFYQELFRLRGWQWKGMKVNRPQVVAAYTRDLVYERLAPGILQELETRNPKDDKGRRKHKHHQWLTEEVGHPALAQHLYAIMGFMRFATSWKQFKEMVQKAFPKKGETLFLPIAEPPK